MLVISDVPGAGSSGVLYMPYKTRILPRSSTANLYTGVVTNLPQSDISRTTRLSFSPLTDTEWCHRACGIPGGQRSVPTTVRGGENGASISGKLFREEKRDNLATYALKMHRFKRGYVQAGHPLRAMVNH
ncbi:hypothetical protein VC83_04975 [Pseudogymnoascus destructans]|uniref:Uncharacterized protein n=1 Tax=Pseudogymnoascus destructans TaxID=655981 RepID=A0A177ABX9_9PEZI|nr:uncharacterized protein VC83_04975 [Pseudogymnoascus destructans]OAF58693.1 hypothetical protein VC83_04975 [Pseudogymnoascus destructans]